MSYPPCECGHPVEVVRMAGGRRWVSHHHVAKHYEADFRTLYDSEALAVAGWAAWLANWRADKGRSEEGAPRSKIVGYLDTAVPLARLAAREAAALPPYVSDYSDYRPRAAEAAASPRWLDDAGQTYRKEGA